MSNRGPTSQTMQGILEDDFHKKVDFDLVQEGLSCLAEQLKSWTVLLNGSTKRARHTCTLYLGCLDEIETSHSSQYIFTALLQQDSLT